MPEITLKNITKRWGNFYGVDNISLDIPNNSFITLLGPSGCGKTTILRMIAGLETPTEGQIKIGDQIVFDSDQGINVPPNKRRVGFLFQNYALWPNMTVYQNIAFGLKNINEEKPRLDIEAKQTSDMIRALQSGSRIKEIVGECLNKDGKLDEEKACLKLIDNFRLSMFTARKLFRMGIHKANDPHSEALKRRAELEARLDTIRKKYEASGRSLNEKSEVMENGRPVIEKRRLSKEEIDARVHFCAHIVKIGMFMDRYPAELSGGQQQRVAIARTLAPEPQVLFMDEPLSNLDAKLRLEMRYELQRLHLETGSTFVYVTHDQMEAMTLATKICLINNGVLQQYDAPLDIYNRPVNLFVGDFVGNPSMNFVEASGSQADDGRIDLSVWDKVRVRFVPNDPLVLTRWQQQRDKDTLQQKEDELQRFSKKGALEKKNKDEVFKYRIQTVLEEDYSMQTEPVISDNDFVLGIRPEAIDIDDNGSLNAIVYGAMPTGMESTLRLRVGDYLLTCVIFGGNIYKIGQDTKININGNDILLFDRRSGRLICAGRLDFI